MAIACLRFFTGCFPSFMWCISVRTSPWAFGPYLRPLDFLLELLDLRPDFLELLFLRELEPLRELELEREFVLRADELLRVLPLDFLELDFFFAGTSTSIGFDDAPCKATEFC
jgi:hypothetical protein